MWIHAPTTRIRHFIVALSIALLCGRFADATVSTITIFSSSNNRNTSFQVYTPPGYTTDAARKYPVVISLHGIGGNSGQRANSYGPALDTQINAGQILPMIWIFPDGQNNS